MPESAPGYAGRTEEAQCYNCGALGHWAIACPEPTRETPAGLAAWRNNANVGQGHNRDHYGGSRKSRGPIITKYSPAPPPIPPPGSVGAGYGPPTGYAQPPGPYPGGSHPYHQPNAYPSYSSSTPGYAPPYAPPSYPPQQYSQPAYGRPPPPPPPPPGLTAPGSYPPPYPSHPPPPPPTPNSSYPVPYNTQPPYGSSYPQPYSYGPPPPAYPPAYPPSYPPHPPHSAPPTYGHSPGPRVGHHAGPPPRHPHPPPRYSPPSASPPLTRGPNLPPSLPPKPPQSRRDHQVESRRDHRNKRKNDRHNRQRDNKHRKNTSNGRSQDRKPHDNNHRPSSMGESQRTQQSPPSHHKEPKFEAPESQGTPEHLTSKTEDVEEYKTMVSPPDSTPELGTGSTDIADAKGERAKESASEEAEKPYPLDEVGEPALVTNTDEVLLPKKLDAPCIESGLGKDDALDESIKPVDKINDLPTARSGTAFEQDGKLPSSELLTVAKPSIQPSETPESGGINERRRKYDERSDDFVEAPQPKRRRSNSDSPSKNQSPRERGFDDGWASLDAADQDAHSSTALKGASHSNEELRFKYRRASYSRSRSISGSPRSRRSSISHASSGLDSLEAELLGRDVKMKPSDEAEERSERDEGKPRMRRRRQPRLDSAYSRRW